MFLTKKTFRKKKNTSGVAISNKNVKYFGKRKQIMTNSWKQKEIMKKVFAEPTLNGCETVR